MKHLKRAGAGILAAIGVHEHLSAQQKQDISVAALQSSPGVTGTGAMQMTGFELADVVAVVTVLFIVLQIAHLVWKWRRQARIDAEHRAQNRALPSTDFGGLR